MARHQVLFAQQAVDAVQVAVAIAQLFADELDAAAQAALDETDPRAGLEQFLEFVGTFNAKNRRYAAALADRVTNDHLRDDSSDAVNAATADKVRQLTQNAVDARALAAHVTATDVKALIVALRTIVATAPDDHDDSWRRFLRIHLAGLRADGNNA